MIFAAKQPPSWKGFRPRQPRSALQYPPSVDVEEWSSAWCDVAVRPRISRNSTSGAPASTLSVERQGVNRYGRMAERQWTAVAPLRVATLPDPVRFFSELGETLQAEVSDLAATLAGPDPVGESYLAKVARLRTATREAEEIVMRQLMWAGDPGLPLEQAREEWDQTSPSDEYLARWAERMQDSPDLLPATDELEAMAAEWAVPVEFLHQLVAAHSPWNYLRDHAALRSESATIRFLREIS